MQAFIVGMAALLLKRTEVKSESSAGSGGSIDQHQGEGGATNKTETDWSAVLAPSDYK